MSRFARWLGTAWLFASALLAQGQQTGDASFGEPAPAEATSPNLGGMSLEELLQVKVEGAALHAQTLQDAPASVTIITAEDIRKYGYRTVGEALSSVRGFYLNNDYTFENIGVRGFGTPSDYASDILFLVNGHSMTGNIMGYMLLLGNNFPIDINLIKQIEIIRGPSSALYGSNGMFATVNIVTKTPEEAGPASLTTTVNSFGEKKGEVTATAPVGKNGTLLFAGSVFNNAGQSPMYFPQYNSPGTNNGEAIDMNGERGYHLFANLTWRNWSVVAAFSSDDMIQPISWGYTIFNDRGTQNTVARNFVDATWVHPLRYGTLTWRTYYDEERYLGRFEYPLYSGDVVEDNRTLYNGKCAGSELRYQVDVRGLGEVTAALEGKFDIRAQQWDYDVSPVLQTFLNIATPDRNYSLLLQDERRLSAHWTLDLGARADKSQLLHDFFSPRVALIYRPHSGWTYKFLYGRSFRNPSLFQLYYGDGLSQIANPSLGPESADTFEVDAERKLGKRWNLLSAAYGYEMHHFIDGIPQSSGLIQYQNEGTIRAGGVELEVNGKVSSRLEATASYAIQKTTDLDEGSVLENSPEQLAKLHFAVPVGRKFELSSGMQYTGLRVSLAQHAVGGYYLADFTLTSHTWLPYFDFTLGVRNAFNRPYYDPVALTGLVDTMEQPGRSVFVELIPHLNR